MMVKELIKNKNQKNLLSNKEMIHVDKFKFDERKPSLTENDDYGPNIEINVKQNYKNFRANNS